MKQARIPSNESNRSFNTEKLEKAQARNWGQEFTLSSKQKQVYGKICPTPRFKYDKANSCTSIFSPNYTHFAQSPVLKDNIKKKMINSQKKKKGNLPLLCLNDQLTLPFNPLTTYRQNEININNLLYNESNSNNNKGIQATQSQLLFKVNNSSQVSITGTNKKKRLVFNYSYINKEEKSVNRSKLVIHENNFEEILNNIMRKVDCYDYKNQFLYQKAILNLIESEYDIIHTVTQSLSKFKQKLKEKTEFLFHNKIKQRTDLPIKRNKKEGQKARLIEADSDNDTIFHCLNTETKRLFRDQMQSDIKSNNSNHEQPQQSIIKSISEKNKEDKLVLRRLSLKDKGNLLEEKVNLTNETQFQKRNSAKQLYYSTQDQNSLKTKRDKKREVLFDLNQYISNSMKKLLKERLHLRTLYHIDNNKEMTTNDKKRNNFTNNTNNTSSNDNIYINNKLSNFLHIKINSSNSNIKNHQTIKPKQLVLWSKTNKKVTPRKKLKINKSKNNTQKFNTNESHNQIAKENILLSTRDSFVNLNKTNINNKINQDNWNKNLPNNNANNETWAINNKKKINYKNLNRQYTMTQLYFKQRLYDTILNLSKDKSSFNKIKKYKTQMLPQCPTYVSIINSYLIQKKKQEEMIQKIIAENNKILNKAVEYEKQISNNYSSFYSIKKQFVSDRKSFSLPTNHIKNQKRISDTDRLKFQQTLNSIKALKEEFFVNKEGEQLDLNKANLFACFSQELVEFMENNDLDEQYNSNFHSKIELLKKKSFDAFKQQIDNQYEVINEEVELMQKSQEKGNRINSFIRNLRLELSKRKIIYGIEERKAQSKDKKVIVFSSHILNS